MVSPEQFHIRRQGGEKESAKTSERKCQRISEKLDNILEAKSKKWLKKKNDELWQMLLKFPGLHHN